MNLIVFFTTLILSTTLKFSFGFKVQCNRWTLKEKSCANLNVEVPLDDNRVEFDLTYANPDNITYVYFMTPERNRGFTEFPVEIFEFFGNVDDIFINSNIEKLSKDDWKNAHQLKSLDLRFNKLSDFLTFNGLNKLERLSLPHNQITIIRHELFRELDRLNYLDLQFNKIHRIEPGVFDSTKNLREIILSFNQITDIRSGTFVGLGKLRKLELKFNRIRTIEDGAFDVPDLRVLQLSYNKLTTVSDSVFSKMPSLEQLQMQQNELTLIDPSIFSLLNLTDINLSKNHITNINILEFAQFRRLKILQLSGSGFSYDSLKGNKTDHPIEDNISLEYLDITNNGLTDLNVGWQVAIFKGLKFLNMMGNNFTNYDILNAVVITTALPNLNKITFDGTAANCENFEIFKNDMKDLNVNVLLAGRCSP